MTTDDLTRTPPTELRRARIAFLIVAVVFPVLVSGAAVAVLISWLPSFPHDVAIHWGVDGADGFGPASTYVWLLLGVGLGVPLLMTVTTLVAVGSHWGGAARLMGALSAGMAAFAAVMALGSLALQRDLADPTAVPGIGGVMALCFGALLGIGAVAWFVQPRVRPEQGRTLEPRHAVRVAAGERVVWVASATMPRGVLTFLVLVLIGLVALAAYMLIAAIPGAWIAGLVVLVVGFAIASTTSFRVQITPEGFAARSLAGWPRIRIPVTEITGARAVDISPFGEFGGWGWRISADGRSGIVMRRGSAVEVSRRDRRAFLVTIDGAEEAAALLQAYVDRAASAGSAAERPTQGDEGRGTR